MVPFKFKLSGLLKLREFKETKKKIELGQIVKKINEYKERIVELNKGIDESYLSQEKLLRQNVDGKMLQFFPRFIEAKKNDIKNNQKLLDQELINYEEKVNELEIVMGEVKVVEKLKEKEKIRYNKKFTKKEQENNEDLMRMKRSKEIL